MLYNEWSGGTGCFWAVSKKFDRRTPYVTSSQPQANQYVYPVQLSGVSSEFKVNTLEY